MTTRDVSNFALVTSDSFPASPRVFFLSTQCELCKFCLTQCGVEQAQRVLQVLLVSSSVVSSSL